MFINTAIGGFRLTFPSYLLFCTKIKQGDNMHVKGREFLHLHTSGKSPGLQDESIPPHVAIESAIFHPIGKMAELV